MKVLMLAAMVWAEICTVVSNECEHGLESHEDKDDNELCCISVPCPEGTGTEMCSAHGLEASCKPCQLGTFQSHRYDSYRMITCEPHNPCKQFANQIVWIPGNSVNNSVCLCDFKGGFEPLIKTQDLNPRVCRRLRPCQDGMVYKLNMTNLRPECVPNITTPEHEFTENLITASKLTTELPPAMGNVMQPPTTENMMPPIAIYDSTTWNIIQSSSFTSSIVFALVGVVVVVIILAVLLVIVITYLSPRDNQRASRVPLLEDSSDSVKHDAGENNGEAITGTLPLGGDSTDKGSGEESRPSLSSGGSSADSRIESVSDLQMDGTNDPTDTEEEQGLTSVQCEETGCTTDEIPEIMHEGEPNSINSAMHVDQNSTMQGSASNLEEVVVACEECAQHFVSVCSCCKCCSLCCTCYLSSGAADDLPLRTSTDIPSVKYCAASDGKNGCPNITNLYIQNSVVTGLNVGDNSHFYISPADAHTSDTHPRSHPHNTPTYSRRPESPQCHLTQSVDPTDESSASLPVYHSLQSQEQSTRDRERM